MTTVTARSLACSVALLGALGSARSLSAQLGVGTWVRKSTESMPGSMTMTVQACCHGGRRLIYNIGTKTLLSLESPFDGSEVPVLVNGKPSGETMAIKRLDSRHLFTVVKLNGQRFGTSKATLSPDARTLTVINEYSSSIGGQAAGKSTEIWVRK